MHAQFVYRCMTDIFFFIYICVESSLFSNDYWRLIFIKHAYSIIPLQYEEAPISMYITRLIPSDPTLSIRSR